MSIDANSILQAAAQAAGAQQYPAGTLYVVATPIGNLADLSLRAIHVLSKVDQIACEDTRMTQRLLQHLGLHRPLVAVHQHNEAGAAEQIVRDLQAGQRIAFVSDAGTPGVSDPGARLVQAVRAAGLRIVPLPGPSAPVTLMSVAGDVQADGFTFAGFLPAKAMARREALAGWATHPLPVVFFESPHRIDELARDLATLDADRTITVGRELTKQFEDIAMLKAGDLSLWLSEGQRQRGEFVLVWHAAAAAAPADELSAPWLELLDALIRTMPLKEAARLLAPLSGWSRNRLYERALALRDARPSQD